ncbi:MAG: hypothetical protein CVU42_12575 [Chloroflexi bacterium HGW-Chloroflexi-4]|jgi:hypothetical protein|nr:MAG: hypothetical protein CVU42_12575 [Chloroflexi bacterium HGW-Chloroflexi-4]
MKKKLFWLPIIALIIIGCGKTPTPMIVTSQVTQLVTQLVTVEVTREIIITATYSGPTATATITNTPTPTNTPEPTVDTTKTDKRDGSFMVGSEIAPGIWRSSGGVSDKECALVIKSYSGDTKDITYSLPGGTIRIPSGEFIVYIGGGSGNECIWTFLQP